MTTPVTINDSNSGLKAKVTKFGQLVTSPLQYSTPVAVTLNSTGTAFNILEPVAGESIVITDIIASADKDVSNTTPADIEIYEADAIDDLVASPSIVRPQLIRAGNASYIGLNLLVPEGKYVNAKTTDIGILLTVMYYRVPQEFV